MTDRRPVTSRRGNDLGIKVGVSRIVTGRQKKGGRVTFEHEGRQLTTERLVATRCRQKSMGAFLLPSSLWRDMAELERLERTSRGEALGELVKKVSPGKKSRRLSAPLVEALRAGLKVDKLRKLIERHTSADFDTAHPGVPDLFVYRKGADGTPEGVKFVEVKRGGSPAERLMPHQREEILFLQGIGIKAGVLYLEERAGGAPGKTEPERRPGIDEVADALSPVLDALRGGNDAFRRRERERTRAARKAPAGRQKRKARLTVIEGGRPH